MQWNDVPTSDAVSGTKMISFVVRITAYYAVLEIEEFEESRTVPRSHRY
jgi:hypothetical protein